MMHGTHNFTLTHCNMMHGTHNFTLTHCNMMHGTHNVKLVNQIQSRTLTYIYDMSDGTHLAFGLKKIISNIRNLGFVTCSVLTLPSAAILINGN